MQGMACAPGQQCVGDFCACNATSCPNGCCSGTTCIPFGSQNNTLCGPGGAACANCTIQGQSCNLISHKCEGDCPGFCFGSMDCCCTSSGTAVSNQPDDKNCGSYGEQCADCTSIFSTCQFGFGMGFGGGAGGGVSALGGGGGGGPGGGIVAGDYSCGPAGG
jgi:hypothetical protein